jgi:tetratricopeptide (TPR) repeat protein
MAKGSSSGGGSHAQIATTAMTEDRKRLGRRLLAFAGVWLLVSGLLTALSLVVVALAGFALLLLVALTAGAAWALRRVRIRPGVRTASAQTERALGAAGHGVGAAGRRLRELDLRERGRRVGNLARETTSAAPQRAEALLTRGLRGYATAVYRLQGQTARVLRTNGGAATSLSRLPSFGRKREALELNELGARLRREGAPEEAAEQHRVALEIIRDLGDEQAEALTLNNLALALAQGGAEEEAVEHLEQALLVLREIGDDEHEGLVIANLGSVHRRQGHTEEAVTLLHEALDKLPPESSAYRQVEEELQRAS